MTSTRVLFVTVTAMVALLLQTTVVERLPLPGAAPDLLLLVVVAVALVEGPRWGMGTGFGAGLLADLAGDHQLGRLALAYVVVGYLAGCMSGDADRPTSQLLPLGAAAVGAVAALLVFAGEGILLGDPRVTSAALGRSLVSTVPYSVALAPVVVRLAVAVLVRLDRGGSVHVAPVAVRR